MRVKIISDGTKHGTKIVNAETGEQLQGVTCIEWHLDAKDRLANLMVRIHGVPVELEGELITHT